MITEQRYAAAQTFQEFLATANANIQLWASIYARAQVPPEFVSRVEALRGSWHLLIVNEDWCGDAVNTVPPLIRLAESSANLDARIIARDQNLDIMDAHLTGTSRSIPIAIVLDESYRECGWWGPRPTELQEWRMGPAREMESAARYRDTRMWYARDRGVSTLEEVVSLMESMAR